MCIVCFLLGALGQLVACPISNFTCATVTLQEHSKQSSHKVASMDAIEFTNRKESGRLSVYQSLQKQASTLVHRNRFKLKSILKTITFVASK